MSNLIWTTVCILIGTERLLLLLLLGVGGAVEISTAAKTDGVWRWQQLKQIGYC